LSADKDATTSAQIAKRLEVLAARFVEAVPQGSVKETTEWNISPLFCMIDTGLRRLEEASV
jgi:hypothetical protein